MVGQMVLLVGWLLAVVVVSYWCVATLLRVGAEARARGERPVRGRRHKKGPNDLAPWDRL